MIRYFLGITFLLFGSISGFAQGNTNKLTIDKIVGAVGDRIVLQSDIQNAISDAMRNNQELPANASCSILEQMLISKILALQAERDSIPLSDDEVEGNLDTRVRNWIMQFGSVEAVEEVANKSIYQLKEDSRASIKENMLADRMKNKIVETVHITPTEVKNYFEKVPADSVPFIESELEIGQINIFPKAAKEVEEYINNEMLNYRKQILAGTLSFSDAAKKYSDDPGSKERGGFLEVNRNDKNWDPIFMSVVFRLKAGETSIPFKSPKFGFFLIQCESRRGDDAKIRYLLRIPPVTETELVSAKAKLDSVRREIIDGRDRKSVV